MRAPGASPFLSRAILTCTVSTSAAVLRPLSLAT